MTSHSESVKVVARCRPLLPHESQSSFQCIRVSPTTNEIILSKGPDSSKDEDKCFPFDEVLDPKSSQQLVYETSSFQLIESIMEGYHGTIFAYGQTSSGKTFTMMGNPLDSELKGLIPRCFSHIISIIHSSNEKKFIIRCSFLEIYNEEIFDLLKPDKKFTKLEIRHSPTSGFFVKDLSQIIVNSEEEMLKVMNLGNKNKSMSETSMNANSSRSHTIMIVNIESFESFDKSAKPRVTLSKLNLVDLAGSERVGKSGINSDKQLKECTKINLSLSALGNVISALVEGKAAHIPYRDSKLTRILEDSLGGNTKTVMIAAFSPSFSNYGETLGTLRYATRARLIKNKPKINEDPKDALIRQYMDEIRNLKERLAKGGSTQDFLKEMKNFNQILEENKVLQLSRDQLAEELKNKEDILTKTMVGNKGEVEGMFEYLQSNLVGGNSNNEEEKKKLELARKKIRQQKKTHAQIVAQAKEKEEELLAQISTLQAKQIQADPLPSQQALFHKYKNALYEIEDLKRENEYEKETFLDSIRDQQKEIEFYEEVLKNILSQEEIDKIRSHTIWSESSNKYKVPPFIFKEKTIKFPNLTYAQSQGMNNEQKQLRDLKIECGLIEEDSDDSNENVEKTIGQIVLPNLVGYKRPDLKLNVKPLIKQIKGFDIEKLKLIQKRDAMELIDDFESPGNMKNDIANKKSYLRTLDTVIDSYTDKYSKDKIIFPQKYSIYNTMSFTDFKDLERDIDIQTIKAKRNLNNLLDPLPGVKNEERLKEIIDANIKPLRTPGNTACSVGKFHIKSPFISLKSPFVKGDLPPIEKKKQMAFKN